MSAMDGKLSNDVSERFPFLFSTNQTDARIELRSKNTSPPKKSHRPKQPASPRGCGAREKIPFRPLARRDILPLMYPKYFKFHTTAKNSNTQAFLFAVDVCVELTEETVNATGSMEEEDVVMKLIYDALRKKFAHYGGRSYDPNAALVLLEQAPEEVQQPETEKLKQGSRIWMKETN
jgi:hypothetical protein